MDRDGFVEIQISVDAMTVTADFFAAIGVGRQITPDYVDSLLEGNGILYGIQTETIQETVFAINTEHRNKAQIVVARGLPPRAERPEHFRLSPPKRDLDDVDSDRVDFKSQSRLNVVQAGQVIARIIPHQEGEVGYNVRGEELPFSVENVPGARPGKNTRVADGRVVAVVGGQLIANDKEFIVEDTIQISGDVGYRTGSIEFPGDVVLKGEIKDGFHVWAGGNIEAHQTIGVSEIYCRKEFSAKGGLVGRGERALLRAGGRIQARFIENCYIESKSSIFVKDYVYQVHMATLDRLAMGKTGRIVGGVVTSAKGLRCNEAGNKANAPTLVRVGIDFIAERQVRIVREKLDKVSTKLQALRARRGHDPTDRQLDILHRLDSARVELLEKLQQLTVQLDIEEAAEIEVDGTVYPGVAVQICRATYTVEEQMSKVRFTLDKRTGRIIPVEMK